MEKGNLRKARDMFTKLISELKVSETKIDPTAFMALHQASRQQLGILHLRSGHFSKAAKELDEACIIARAASKLTDKDATVKITPHFLLSTTVFIFGLS